MPYELIEPQTQYEIIPPPDAPKISTRSDVTKSVVSAIPKAGIGVLSLPDLLVGGLVGGVEKLQNWWQGRDVPFAMRDAGVDPLLTKKVEAVTGPLHQPQTTPGRYAGAITQGALSAPLTGMGGTLGVLTGALSGAGGEAGSDLTGGSTVGRIAGSVLAPLPLNIYQATRNLAQARIANATRDADWQAATARAAAADRTGVQLTAPEILNNRDLLGAQLLTENSPHSANILDDFMSQRPGQVAGAVNRTTGTLGARGEPSTIASNVQTMATDAIDATRQAGNARATPFYAAAGTQRVPSNVWNSIANDPAMGAALTAVRRNPLLGLQNEAEGSVRWLDAAKKYLDNQATPSLTANALERTGSSQAGVKASQLRGMVDAQVPEYGQARRIVENNIRTNVEPMEASTIGRLANKENANLGQQFKSVIDPAQNATPASVQQTIRQLRMRNPGAAESFIREGIELQWDAAQKAVRDRTAGQFAGARFAQAMRETPQTAENIRTMIGELPNGAVRVRAFNNLLDTLEMTGNRLPTGSRTAFNAMQQAETSVAGVIKSAVESPSAPFKAWMQRLDESLTARRLADAFTGGANNEERIRNLRALAFERPGSARARIAISGLLGLETEQ